MTTFETIFFRCHWLDRVRIGINFVAKIKDRQPAKLVSTVCSIDVFFLCMKKKSCNIITISIGQSRFFLFCFASSKSNCIILFFSYCHLWLKKKKLTFTLFCVCVCVCVKFFFLLLYNSSSSSSLFSFINLDVWFVSVDVCFIMFSLFQCDNVITWHGQNSKWWWWWWWWKKGCYMTNLFFFIIHFFSFLSENSFHFNSFMCMYVLLAIFFNCIHTILLQLKMIQSGDIFFFVDDNDVVVWFFFVCGWCVWNTTTTTTWQHNFIRAITKMHEFVKLFVCVLLRYKQLDYCFHLQ